MHSKSILSGFFPFRLQALKSLSKLSIVHTEWHEDGGKSGVKAFICRITSLILRHIDITSSCCTLNTIDICSASIKYKRAFCSSIFSLVLFVECVCVCVQQHTSNDTDNERLSVENRKGWGWEHGARRMKEVRRK